MRRKNQGPLIFFENSHMSRPDPEKSTRGNRRMPLSGSQFPKNPSKDSQGIWHPSPFEKRFITLPIMILN